MNKLSWSILTMISGLYLLNPGMGVFEFLPDNLPIIGNIDETIAALILLRSLMELNIIKETTVEKVLNFKDKYEKEILKKKDKQSKK